jgi:hypothetical protein
MGSFAGAEQSSEAGQPPDKLQLPKPPSPTGDPDELEVVPDEEPDEDEPDEEPELDPELEPELEPEPDPELEPELDPDPDPEPDPPSSPKLTGLLLPPQATKSKEAASVRTPSQSHRAFIANLGLRRPFPENVPIEAILEILPKRGHRVPCDYNFKPHAVRGCVCAETPTRNGGTVDNSVQLVGLVRARRSTPGPAGFPSRDPYPAGGSPAVASA